MLKKVIFVFILLSFYLSQSSSKIFYFNYECFKKFKFAVRANYKVYINGKYTGLDVKEQQYLMNTYVDNNSIKIEGNAFLYKKTISSDINYATKIDRTEHYDYIINKQGKIVKSNKAAFLPLTDLPFFPENNLNPGDIYKSKAFYLVDFDDFQEQLPVTAATQYSGIRKFLGSDYDFFEISFVYDTVKDNSNILKANGRHNMEFYFNYETGMPVYIKDVFVDEFQIKNGQSVKRDGFIMYFYNMIVPMNKSELLKDLTTDIDVTVLKDIDIKNKNEGLSLTINNLLFKADTVELLSSESEKIDSIYRMLSRVKDRSFMIIGHTAFSGTEVQRKQLSVDRAKAIAEALIKKGLDAKKIFYDGKGAEEPVAPNDTENNMQKNRRVEIIILEN